MRKLMIALLALSSISAIADEVGKYCSFYIKMTPTNSGYQVVATSDDYINAPNVLYGIYDMDAKGFTLLTIPKNDNPDFKCNSEYDTNNTNGYCRGDFILDEDSANKIDSSNVITNSLKGFKSSLNNFLGSDKIREKRKSNKPFVPYPDPNNIKIAQESSDLMSSQFTKVAILGCEQERSKLIAKKKQEDEQLKKDAQLRAKTEKAEIEAKRLCGNIANNFTKTPISASKLKATDDQITKIYRKYGLNSNSYCRRKLYWGCALSTGKITTPADRMLLSNCMVVANSCKEDSTSACY